MSQELSVAQQQALLELLQGELRAACERALGAGVPPGKLDALIAARAAALKADREGSAESSQSESSQSEPSQAEPSQAGASQEAGHHNEEEKAQLPIAPSHVRRPHGPPCDGAARRRAAKSG